MDNAKIAVIGLGYVGLPLAHDIYQGMEEAIEWYIESIGTK